MFFVLIYIYRLLCLYVFFLNFPSGVFWLQKNTVYRDMVSQQVHVYCIHGWGVWEITMCVYVSMGLQPGNCFYIIVLYVLYPLGLQTRLTGVDLGICTHVCMFCIYICSYMYLQHCIYLRTVQECCYSPSQNLSYYKCKILQLFFLNRYVLSIMHSAWAIYDFELRTGIAQNRVTFLLLVRLSLNN